MSMLRRRWKPSETRRSLRAVSFLYFLYWLLLPNTCNLLNLLDFITVCTCMCTIPGPNLGLEHKFRWSKNDAYYFRIPLPGPPTGGGLTEKKQGHQSIQRKNATSVLGGHHFQKKRVINFYRYTTKINLCFK